MKIIYILCAIMCTGQVVHASQVTVQKQVTPKRIDHALNTLLLDAAHRGDVQTIEKLFAGETIPDITAQNKDGDTALILASKAEIDGSAIVRIVLDAGADVNAKNKYGYTALIVAVSQGKAAAVRMLLAAGADVNAKTTAGYTALTWAYTGNHYSIVYSLLVAGAHFTEQEYRTALGHAKDKAALEKAVKTGLAERKAFLERQEEAKKIIAGEVELIPDIATIITEHAYGSSQDLPKSTQLSEKK